MDAKGIWKKWDESIHTTEYAAKRIKSAQSAKLTPIKIDKDDCYGYFQGGHGRYETWLDSCPCVDFRRSKLPCKHIYRLAIELGLIEAEAANDINAIVTPKKERVSLDNTIDIVETLSEDAQHELLGIASIIRSTSPTHDVIQNRIIDELLESGILVEIEPKKEVVHFGKKGEIAELLDKENVPYDKKAKKSQLEEICMKHIPKQTEERFGKTTYTTISIPSIFSPQNIHYYLHRKLDSEYYYNGEVINLPLVKTDLPDDSITEQLVKRGYYEKKEYGISNNDRYYN